MAQAAITTKYTITATTGTTGATWSPQGRDARGLLRWYIAIGVSPLSQPVLAISGALRKATRKVLQGQIAGWIAKVSSTHPVLDAIVSGDVDGYAALPRVADYTRINTDFNRSYLMSDSDALMALDYHCYALLTDAALRANVIGNKPADA